MLLLPRFFTTELAIRFLAFKQKSSELRWGLILCSRRDFQLVLRNPKPWPTLSCPGKCFVDSWFIFDLLLASLTSLWKKILPATPSWFYSERSCTARWLWWTLRLLFCLWLKARVQDCKMIGRLGNYARDWLKLAGIQHVPQCISTTALFRSRQSTCDAKHFALAEIVWVLSRPGILELFQTGRQVEQLSLARLRVSRMAKLMKTFPELMLIVKAAAEGASLDFTYFSGFHVSNPSPHFL